MDRGILARVLCCVIFLAGAGWAFLGGFDAPLQWAIDHPLGTRAEDYLDSSLKRATVGFMSVSAIKGGLAILEGSEVSASLGVGASVEVGDVIQPIYDYVDLAWRTLFTAAATLLAMKVLLAAAQSFASIVLGALLLVAAVAVLGPRSRWLGRYRHRTADVLRALIVAVVALVYVLPAAILGASELSSNITASLLDQADDEIRAVETVLAPVTTSDGGWVERMREARDSMNRLLTQLRSRGEGLFRAALRLIVAYLFDCIVFPLGLALLGVRLAQWGAGYAVSESRWDRWMAVRREDEAAARGWISGPGR